MSSSVVLSSRLAKSRRQACRNWRNDWPGDVLNARRHPFQADTEAVGDVLTRADFRSVLLDVSDDGVVVELGFAGAADQDVLQRDLQVVGFERLLDEVGGPRLHGVDGGPHIAVAGDHDDLGTAPVGLETAQALESVHAGHLEVQQNDAIVVLGTQAQGLFSIAGRVNLVAPARQHLFAQSAQRGFVIDDQNGPIVTRQRRAFGLVCGIFGGVSLPWRVRGGARLSSRVECEFRTSQFRNTRPVM